MKILLPLLISLIAFPALAAEPAAPKMPADIAERVQLAVQFHKIRPLKPQIDQTLDISGEGKELAKVFDYKQVEDASINAMAETFTPAELKAMIAYYSNPAGQSAAAKMSQYEGKFTPVVRAAIDKALVEVRYPKKP